MKMLRVSLWCLLVPCLSVVAQTDMMSYVKVVRRGKHLMHAVVVKLFIDIKDHYLTLFVDII